MQEILLDLTKPLTDMQLTSDVYIKGIFKGKVMKILITNFA